MGKSVKKEYLELLSERKKTSRVYRQYQSIGLELAEILEDRSHKSLYMKLAKNYDSQMLIVLAKDVAARQSVLNKGAYFMRLLQKETRKNKKNGR